MFAKTFLGALALGSSAYAGSSFTTKVADTTCAYTVTQTASVTKWVPDAPIGAAPTSYRPEPSPYGGDRGYPEPAWVPKGSDLTPGLDQGKANGGCPLGTDKAPKYTEPLPGYVAADACGKYPDTGITRYYHWTVDTQTIAPDGVSKPGIVINGQFPGPTIEANWGDWIEVTVENKIQTEGTTIHWHGMLLTETPWADGVPSVDQCPIAPNKSFTYRFRAEQYGTSWYHSHYSAQYSGGAFGPLVVHGPKTAEYDEDLGPITLSDWYHADYFTVVKQTMGSLTGQPPPSNNNLINGRMNYPCANSTAPCVPNAGISKFFFTPGKKYRLRLINPSSDGTQKFSIDGHKFTIIAQDNVATQPYETNVITLGVGQRTDVIVEAVGKKGDSYWMRSNLGPVGQNACSDIDGISYVALAAVYYDGANTNSVPASTSDVTDAQIANCNNDPLNVALPYCAESADIVGPLTTQRMDIDIINNGTAFVWRVNNSTARVDYNRALLVDYHNGNVQAGPEANIYEFGRNASTGTVRLVLYNHLPFSGHPMHLHGHDFQVLAQGFGQWDGSIAVPSNPVRRDVHILPKAQSFAVPAYSVLQYKLNNPGVWPFHCHLAWHVSAGLYTSLVERPQDIQKLALPAQNAQSCVDWAAWTARDFVDQIDSGV